MSDSTVDPERDLPVLPVTDRLARGLMAGWLVACLLMGAGLSVVIHVMLVAPERVRVSVGLIVMAASAAGILRGRAYVSFSDIPVTQRIFRPSGQPISL